MKKLSFLLIVMIIWTSVYPKSANADDWYEESQDYFTVYLSDGTVLFKIGRRIYVGDQYISQDNKKYIVTQVNTSKKIAIAKFVEDVELPDVSALLFNASVSAFAQDKDKTIGIYCTHTDESYLPSDGKASIKGKGGILDVARKLGETLRNKGIKAIVDTTSHDPHDAGAYRRSRQTAFKIIKEHRPVALFDLHRDAVPKEEYITRLNNQEITKVRIVVGRSNQNRQANEAFAYRIKAVADKQYPGLIKDIFIGKGSYNQELHPQSLLLEFGTYDHTKERALRSASLFAEVVNMVLFGGTIRNEHTQQKEKVPQLAKESTGAEKGGILVLLFILIAGGGAFFYLSSGKEELRVKIRNLRNLILDVKESISSRFRK